MFATNLFARGFEADDTPYAVATAFEVLEHLPDPLGHLIAMRDRYRFHTIFFSATCFDPGDIPDRDWWYWAFETGQHISFFSNNCLRHMADRLDMRLVHIKGDVYAFTTASSLSWPRGWQRRKLDKKFRTSSLTQTDYDVMKQRVKAHQ